MCISKSACLGVVLFLGVFFCALAVRSEETPQIVINGVVYPSFAAYKASKAVPRATEMVSEEDAALMASASKELGLPYDPQKVKTVSLKDYAPKMPDELKKLVAVSEERRAGKVMSDFNQNWDNPTPKLKVNAYELEDRLRALVGDKTEPVFVVAEKKKLRVLTLDSPKTDKP